jgi:hypothetical protein
LFKELTGKEKETKKAAFIAMFLLRKENTKNTKAVFLGGWGVNYLRVFTFRGVSCNPTPTKSDAGVSLKYTVML